MKMGFDWTQLWVMDLLLLYFSFSSGRIVGNNESEKCRGGKSDAKLIKNHLPHWSNQELIIS